MAHYHRYICISKIIECFGSSCIKILISFLKKTWEDPTHIHCETQARGDNDPIDVIEIGEAIGKKGQVKQVKILGVMAMLDEGETDWKVVAVDIKDPMASKLNGKYKSGSAPSIIDLIMLRI